MHDVLLKWAVFSFLIGLVEAVCLVPAMVFGVPSFRMVFVNPAKLKSSHLDFFMQAFALGLVYLLEYATKISLPNYVIVALVYGSICNPLLFLYEATPLITNRVGSRVFPIFMLSSCGSILFAWGGIGYVMLPNSMIVEWLLFIAIVATWMIVYVLKQNTARKAEHTELEEQKEGLSC